jgi:hypothetical protein
MIRMQIQFTEQQARALHRTAEQRGVSQSEVVRLSVDAYLGARSRPDRETVLARARSLVGAFGGAETDVAGRHDDYLADSIADWKRDDTARR